MAHLLMLPIKPNDMKETTKIDAAQKDEPTTAPSSPYEGDDAFPGHDGGNGHDDDDDDDEIEIEITLLIEDKAAASNSLQQSWQDASNSGLGLFPELALNEQDIPDQEPIDRRQFLVKQLSTLCVQNERRRKGRMCRSLISGSTTGMGGFGNVSPTSFLLQELRARMPKDCTVRTCAAKSLRGTFVVFSDAHRLAYDDEIVRTVEKDDIFTLKLWHDQGRTLQAANERDNTLLHVACRRGLLDVVEYLVNNANVSGWVKNVDGTTPWHEAFRRDDPSTDFLDLILEYDVDLLFVRDERGYCPLDLVTRDRWEEWREYMASKDLADFVPKRREFLQMSGKALDDRDELLKYMRKHAEEEEAAVAAAAEKERQQQEQQQEAARRRREAVGTCAEQDSIVDNEDNNDDDDNNNTSGRYSGASSSKGAILRKALKRRLNAVLNQTDTHNSSDFENGLSELSTDALATVLHVNERLMERIGDYEKKEETCLYLEGKVAEINQEYEKRKAQFAEAMLAVQKAAEEVRRNENVLEIAKLAVQKAQQQYKDRKSTYSSAKKEFKTIRKMNRRESSDSIDTISGDSVDFGDIEWERLSERSRSSLSKSSTRSTRSKRLSRSREGSVSGGTKALAREK